MSCPTQLMHAGTYPRVDMTAPRAESPLGVVTMSVHKLTAGSGYDYLTRQVAALDATEKGHTGVKAENYAHNPEVTGSNPVPATNGMPSQGPIAVSATGP
jgi:hypothetical protein